MTTSKPKWNPAKYPIPVEKELQVEYDPETDTLTLWNGTPASNASSVAAGLSVFFDEDEQPQLITLENAGRLLGPLFNQA